MKNSKYFIILLLPFFVLENALGQSNLDNYSRLSFSVGMENLYGFEMMDLPYNLQYRHENQIVPSISINYDIYREKNMTLKIGLRSLWIVEKEYAFIAREYSESPYDINNYITTKTGFGDLRYELLSQYEYRFHLSKNSSLFVHGTGILGNEPNTHFSILEIGTEYNGFESTLIASHKNPNRIYGKLGVGAGINFYTDRLLLQLNFYYHYRLQNFLEGTLIINNSNNERVDRNYVLKGDSYGIGITVYPKRNKKNNN